MRGAVPDPADAVLDAGAKRPVADLLQRLASSGVDYTVFFRALCAAAEDPSADAHVAPLFAEPVTFHTWAESWRRRLLDDEITPAARAGAMRCVNPAFIRYRRSNPPKLSA